MLGRVDLQHVRSVVYSRGVFSGPSDEPSHDERQCATFTGMMRIQLSFYLFVMEVTGSKPIAILLTRWRDDDAVQAVTRLWKNHQELVSLLPMHR